MLAPMVATSYASIKDSLRHLYLEDPRPWLVAFSGGKDIGLLASPPKSEVVGKQFNLPDN